jgi:2-oxoglutarate ferredoxin oxidoreductase subunit alpha
MSADVHHGLVSRLKDKIQRNADDLIKLEGSFMEDARIVVIAFGSTARSARRAVKEARAMGIPAGFLRMISIWPFPEAEIREIAREADGFIVAEMNLGQMTHEVERCVGQPVMGVHHAGGEMMAPDPIFAAIKEVSGRA